MRRFLALVSAAALSASSLYWAGTGVASASHLADANLRAQAASTTTPSIWYVNPLFSYPLWLQSSNYFKQFAKADGYKATVVGNTQINEPQQITDINEAVAAGAQGIITCDLDPATFQKAIKAAEAKGVVVANVGCVDNVANYSVGTNNVQWGQESAQVIEKAVGPDAEIAASGTNLTTPNQLQAYNAFSAYIKAHYPKMKIVATESDQGSPTAATSLIAALPEAYPNLKAIWMFDGYGYVVPRALQEAGVAKGKIFVLAVDALPATDAGIASGWVSATMAQCWFWSGPFVASLIKAKLAGHGPTQQQWTVPLYKVAKQNLPFRGCPASAYPKI
jgi:ABC-type sugar transport system substrate-binding protein